MSNTLFKGTTDETQRPGQRCLREAPVSAPLLCVGSAWGSALGYGSSPGPLSVVWASPSYIPRGAPD